MVTSETTQADDTHRETPAGIVLLCLFLVVYSLLWFVTAAFGTGALAALSVGVAVGVLVLAYFLYAGSLVAWWLALLSVGASTLWRLVLVASGSPDNLSNAVVGTVLLAYLVSQREFYRPLPPEHT